MYCRPKNYYAYNYGLAGAFSYVNDVVRNEDTSVINDENGFNWIQWECQDRNDFQCSPQNLVEFCHFAPHCAIIKMYKRVMTITLLLALRIPIFGELISL